MESSNLSRKHSGEKEVLEKLRGMTVLELVMRLEYGLDHSGTISEKMNAYEYLEKYCD